MLTGKRTFLNSFTEVGLVEMLRAGPSAKWYMEVTTVLCTDVRLACSLEISN